MENARNVYTVPWYYVKASLLNVIAQFEAALQSLEYIPLLNHRKSNGYKQWEKDRLQRE